MHILGDKASTIALLWIKKRNHLSLLRVFSIVLRKLELVTGGLVFDFLPALRVLVGVDNIVQVRVVDQHLFRLQHSIDFVG